MVKSVFVDLFKGSIQIKKKNGSDEDLLSNAVNLKVVQGDLWEVTIVILL